MIGRAGRWWHGVVGDPREDGSSYKAPGDSRYEVDDC